MAAENPALTGTVNDPPVEKSKNCPQCSLRANQPTLLDVLQPWEHEIAALLNSALIPLDQLSNRVTEMQPPDNAVVVVYCHHGIRDGDLESAALSGGVVLLCG